MATESNSQGSAYDGRLFELYTKYVTEPESKKDVYGYTLLVLGYLLAIGGMLIYLVGPTGSEVAQGTLFLVREVAAVGLTCSLLGIVLLLPVTRLSLVGAVLGALVSLAAVVFFVTNYPYNWHVGTPSYSDLIIGLYTAGIAIVAGVVIMVPVITGERSYFSETAQGPQADHPAIMIGEVDRGGLFALFKRGTEWTWRFIDQEAIAGSTTSYLSRLEVEERVESVKSQVAGAGLLEIKNAAFRLYESADGRWQWYLMRDDGSAVAECADDFDARDDADAAINAIKDHGPDAETFVMDEAVYDTYRADGQWHWRLVDENRAPLAEGAEAHPGREETVADLESFRTLSAAATALVIDAYGIELRSADGRWHWRLRDGAHRQLAASEREYGSKGEVEDAAYDLLDRLQRAAVLEAGEPTYDVYRSGSDWAWHLVGPSGRTVADGSERTDDPDAARRQAETMQSQAADADVVESQDLEFETYQTGDGWHWRLVTADRAVHAESTDTYESEAEASRIVDRVRDEAPEADLIEFENAAFELFQDDDGWGWRLVDDIGDTIADGATRHDAEAGARTAMDDLVASVSDVDERTMSAGLFQVYADEDDVWWWRFVLPDGSILADSPASFGTRHAAEDAVEQLQEYAGEAPVETVGRLAVMLDPADWSWDLVDENRETVAAGTVSHGDRDAAVEAVEDLVQEAAQTTVYEIREAAFDCHRAEEGWTWRLVDPDHEPIASAPGTFDDLDAVESAIETVSAVAPDAELVDYDDAAFELFPEGDGWRWHLVDEDQTVLAVAASRYDDREAAERDVADAREEIAAASVIEIDSAAFEFHHTGDGWRWRLVDENGNELGESVQTFESRAAAQEELSTVKELGPDAWVSVAE